MNAKRQTATFQTLNKKTDHNKISDYQFLDDYTLIEIPQT